MSDEKAKEIFAKFIESKKILIADSTAAARSNLYNIFRELGAETNQLFLTNTFNEAQRMIVELKPNVVVAEYDFGNRCGLELLQNQRQQRPAETKDSIFVIVTGNSSQTAVARALEEDVDAFIIKPYTLDSIRNILIRAAVEKATPPPYVAAIAKGKQALQDGDFDIAEVYFNEAIKLDPAPSLACSYIGQIRFIKKIFAEAKANYNRGLDYNKIHYRCLVGLYDLFMSAQNYDEAYEVVRKISKFFPANPKRLAEVIRLAIVTGRYEDIERYYHVFTTLDERNEELIKYTSAALVVCGKHFLSVKTENQRAMELFKKAATTAAYNTKVLCEIVLSLLEYSMLREANMFMMKFPPESFNSNDFLLMRFLVTNADPNTPLAQVIEQGRALLAKKVVDENLYEALIKRSLQAELVPAAEDLLREAIGHFPDKRAHFESVFRGGGKS